MSQRPRLGVLFSTVVLSTAAGLFATAVPAHAGQTNTDAPRIAWAYTDSVHPGTTYLNPTGDAPLGAWRDSANHQHVSRVYVTFDVAALVSRHIVSAKLAVPETQAADCAHRRIEVWATAESTHPTWRNPPRELARLGTLGPADQCPATYPLLDLIDLVNRAEAAGVQLPAHASFEIRLPQALEQQVPLGRRIGAPALYVGYNTPPSAPAPLFNALRACATAAPYPYLSGLTPDLLARASDADPDDVSLTDEFAVWPVAHPDQRTTFTAPASNGGFGGAAVPAGVLTDDITYAWQARVSDGTDASPWSQPCSFTTDDIAPAAPAVTSTSTSTPVTYTLAPNGSGDVYGYQYSWTGIFSVFGANTGPDGPEWIDPFTMPDVVAAQPDGTATITLTPPSPLARLSVHSFDRAFNLSPTTTYRVIISTP